MLCFYLLLPQLYMLEKKYEVINQRVMKQRIQNHFYCIEKMDSDDRELLGFLAQ